MSNLKSKSDIMPKHSLRLLKLQERSLDELILLRNRLLTEPLQINQTLIEEINEKDPLKDKFELKKDFDLDDINEGDVMDHKATSLRLSIQGKRKKDNDINPKFKWEKSNTPTMRQSLTITNTIEPKISSTNVPKNERRSTVKESKKDDKKDEKRDEKQTIVVSSFNDLPKKFQKEVENAKIPIESIEQNFFSLLNILHFCEHGTIFVLKEGDVERKTTSQKKSIPYDIQAKERELLSEGNPKENYKLGNQLGKGGFGTVYEAKPKKKQKEKIAIKVIPHSNSHQKKYNLREVEYLLKYKHTNIVNLYGAYSLNDELWIVMEHLRGGTLTEARNSHRFSEAQIGYISKHLLLGINFLHNNGLIHRDIKSQNVMMAVDGTIKLIDFGLCHDTKIFGNVIEMVGSPYWMPPEMIKGEVHSFVADVWSFAICILELANNEAPNRDNKIKAMYTVATVGLPNPLSKPERWSHNFKWFISACLKTNPTERASAEDLLTHPFFKDCASRSVMTEIFSSIFITKALNTFL